MSVPFNVLISSAGRRVALVDLFRRALRDLDLSGRVVAGDASAVSAAFHHADAQYVVPLCTTDDFIPAVLDLCRREEIHLIVPTIDTELSVYAAHRARFAEAGITVAVSSQEAVALSEDKLLTHAWLTANGFPTVRQTEAGEVGSDGWRFPLLVKPRRGNSSTRVAVVHDALEFQASVRDGDFLVQSIAPGVEYTIDMLADRKGALVCAVSRRRLEVRAGESSKGITHRSETLLSLALRLCEALPGAYGALTVQVFLDAGGQEANVIEINPRFGGGFPLSAAAGADFPRWMIEEILGRPSSADPNAWRDGLVMLRYDAAVFIDASEAGL